MKTAKPKTTRKAKAVKPSVSDKLNVLTANVTPATFVPPPHVIVKARAGTGKTTTLIEGLKALKGLPTKIVPSPQQQAVWDAILETNPASTVCFCCFNKSIQTELASRVPVGCDAMTMHSMGFKAVCRSFGKVQVSDWCTKDHIADILGIDIREYTRDNRGRMLVDATCELVQQCKLNLVNPTPDNLDQLAGRYDVDMNGSRSQVYELVPAILERCKDVAKNKRIDYADMIWLPIALELPIPQYDLLLVDESQDLSRCQQELAKRAGKRLICVGDDRQAIYGFAGADSASIARLKSDLSATEAGCIELPLTVTRRCGKAIVAEACKIVPDFEAHESNGEGSIGNARLEAKGDETGEYSQYVKDADMVICRTNSPLVSQCFRFLKQGRKAKIQGKDVERGLVSTVERLKAFSMPDLIEKLQRWMDAEVQKEQAKKNPSEARLIALQDRYDCLMVFVDNALDKAISNGRSGTPQDVVAEIKAVFTDDKSAVGIRLSSIHRAKGLESDRVFFLMPKGGECPHPMARSEWQKEQESNLLYVGITRARHELVYVK